MNYNEIFILKQKRIAELAKTFGLQEDYDDYAWKVLNEIVDNEFKTKGENYMTKQEIENIKIREELKKLSKPLIEYLNKNYNPHCKIIITTTSSEVLSGEQAIYTEEYIQD